LSEQTDDPNGHRITIQSCENDGNKTEEKKMSETLVIKRLTNGMREDIGRTGRAGEEF
jgi:hypothetical protein